MEKMKGFSIVPIVHFVIMVILFVGEIKCIYKAVNCNWEPVGKAEVIYTGSAMCGLGAIVGYIDIKDK